MVRLLRACALLPTIVAMIWVGSAGAGQAVDQRRPVAPPRADKPLMACTKRFI